TIDPFASRAMKRCERYCSPQQDRRAVRRNAMSFSWIGERPLIYCPIEMIPRVLNKINRDQIEALLILPQWCIYKFKQLLPQITFQIDLGHSQLVIEPGPMMKVLELKLPPGNIIALRVTNSGTVNTLIANTNFETWRKRRSGLTLLDDYLQTVIIPITSLIGDRPDIIPFNSLNWVKKSESNQQNLITKKFENIRISHSKLVLQDDQCQPFTTNKRLHERRTSDIIKQSEAQSCLEP
ncbi:MAG: hypothetical protein EZS28_050548, partial [Streblomastix strix]